MPKQNVFCFLVRHEFRKGIFMAGRQETDHRDISRRQWIILGSLMILAWIVFATFAALHGHYHMEGAWFFTVGFPWMMYAIGAGEIKKEWRNKTEGWWLSLPYPRLQLIGAKFVSAWLKVLLMLVCTYLFAFLYALYMTLIQGHFHFHFHPVALFMLKGTEWFSLLLSLSPVFVSLGILNGLIRYTTLHSIRVIFLAINILFAFFFYNGIASLHGKDNLFMQFNGLGAPDIISYFHLALVLILIGLILTYFVLRLSASLMEKKLDL